MAATLETKPTPGTHWSTRSMAEHTGMTQNAVLGIGNAFGLQPHRQESFKLSTDSFFIDKVRDVWASTSTRPSVPWRCAWTRSPGSRHSTGPNRYCR